MNWRGYSVHPDATHHTVEGVPAYSDRFDEVLKFHEPGLAPVLRGGEAWHIRPDGTEAYPQRHQRTFGFYEGLAAVSSRDGWLHIRPDGEAAHPARFAWSGNFQGGRCTVRDGAGRYFHILPTGAPLATERWRYAGDFRDGIAVVMGDHGRSTHIDASGRLVHGKWFLDLDVFHKGFARARDEGGWMHVDEDGLPAYSRRFAQVEPFYNGQSRVEGFDGSLEVIDEAGVTVVQLRPALRSDSSGPGLRTISRLPAPGFEPDVVAEFARAEVAQTIGSTTDVRFFIAGGAFKSLLTNRDAHDLDMWAASPTDREELVQLLLRKGATPLRPGPFSDRFQIAGRIVDVPHATDPHGMEDRLAGFDLALSAIGVEFSGGRPVRTIVHPLANESVTRREVLLLKPLVNWKHCLSTLARLRRYGRELGFHVRGEEELEVWTTYLSQDAAGRARMIERYLPVQTADLTLEEIASRSS